MQEGRPHDGRLPFIESQIGQVQIKEGNVFGTYLEEAI